MNDNIDLQCLENVRMTSAKSFGYSIYEAGRGAIMSKFDIVAAYKQMPAKLEDYPLQGFRWLNRFFVETKQIFGAITSVSNFDQLGKTVLDITLDRSQIPKNWYIDSLMMFQWSGLSLQAGVKNFQATMKKFVPKLTSHLHRNAQKRKKPLKMKRWGKSLL